MMMMMTTRDRTLSPLLRFRLQVFSYFLEQSPERLYRIVQSLHRGDTRLRRFVRDSLVEWLPIHACCKTIDVHPVCMYRFHSSYQERNALFG